MFIFLTIYTYIFLKIYLNTKLSETLPSHSSPIVTSSIKFNLPSEISNSKNKPYFNPSNSIISFVLIEVFFISKSNS